MKAKTLHSDAPKKSRRKIYIAIAILLAIVVACGSSSFLENQVDDKSLSRGSKLHGNKAAVAVALCCPFFYDRLISFEFGVPCGVVFHVHSYEFGLHDMVPFV